MLMHQETCPRTRVKLFLQDLREESVVWEVWDKVPPSTAPELEPDVSPSGDSPRGQASLRKQLAFPELLPALVMEVSDDGEVVTWPGPKVLG